MKTHSDLPANAGFKTEERKYSAPRSGNLKETAPACASTGLTQENYINPLYLRTGMGNSISNVSNWGAWV